MKHPLAEKNQAQEEFLRNCPAKDRRFHELFFKIGNATYVYYEQGRGLVPGPDDWEEYLRGVEEPLREKLKTAGMEKMKDSLPFRRFLLESRDFGLDEFLVKNINEEDLKEYKELINQLEK